VGPCKVEVLPSSISCKQVENLLLDFHIQKENLNTRGHRHPI
jgi:hypothetical protein